MARSVGKNNTKEKYPRLQISDFPILKSGLFNSEETKDNIIKTWLKEYIEERIKSNTIAENTLLPIKSKLAYYFGVGEGTVQSAVRKLEDEGIVISKQRIGTFIIIDEKNDFSLGMNKLTSKRDKIVSQIKVIIKNNYPIGTVLPSIRELEEILNSKKNTIRAAMDLLVYQGYIKPVMMEKEENKHWEVISEISEDLNIDFELNIQAETLIQKISTQIEDYISQTCKVGSRLAPINVLAKKYNVSDKTIYDAVQILAEKGIVQARRGKYGTIITKMPNEAFQPSKERSIFMPAAEAAVYSYRRIENLLRNKIINDYSVGEKLPSMKELAAQLDVSTNTIRKAIMDLTAEGYLAVSRGKFGGIYVLDIPQESTQSFRWLAVNPQYVKSYK